MKLNFAKIFKLNLTLILVISFLVLLSVFNVVLLISLSEKLIKLIYSEVFLNIAKLSGLNNVESESFIQKYYPDINYNGLELTINFLNTKYSFEKLSILTFSFIILNLILTFIYYSLADRLGKKVGFQVRNLMLAYFLTSQVDVFKSEKKIINNILYQSKVYEDFFRKNVINLVQIFLTTTFISGLLITKDWKLYLIILAFVVLAIAFTFLNNYITSKSIDKNDQLKTSFVNEQIYNKDQILLSNTKKEPENFDKNKINHFNNFFITFIVMGASILLFLLIFCSYFFYINNTYKLITIIPIFITCIGFITIPLLLSTRIVEEYSKLEKFDKNEFEKTIEYSELNTIEEIELKNISVKKDESFILKDVSLNFKIGKINILKGPNGSGKTSILRVILGFLKNNEGDIIFKTKNIIKKNYEINEGFSYLRSDMSLFNSSVKKNILWNVENNDEKKLINICKLLKIDHLLNEQNSDNLSTGQRQKILVARILMQNYKIVILDEAFSNIDSETKTLIIEEFAKLKSEKLIILVDHILEKNSDLFRIIEL